MTGQPRRRPRALSAPLVLFSLALGCSEGTPTASALPPLPEVMFSGCQLIRDGGRCEVTPGQSLTVWVGTALSHELAIGGSPVSDEVQVIEGGVRHRVTVPDRLAPLTITSSGRVLFSLELGPHTAFAELERADQLRLSGHVEQARDLVNVTRERAVGEQQTRARALLARMMLGAGEPERAAAELEQTLEQSHASGRRSDALKDALALCFIYIELLEDLPRARALLEQVRPWLAAMPHGLAAFEHYQGLLAQRQQRLGSAHEHYRNALRYARRIGDDTKARDVAIPLATTLAALGRFDEALTLLEQASDQARTASPCARGPLFAALAWMGMLAGSRSTLPLDVAGHLERALEFDSICGNPRFQRNDLINLGLWALEQQDIESAEAVLSKLEALKGGQTSELAVWEAELSGRLALIREQLPQALSHFTRELVLAQAAARRDDVARALVSRGEVLERLERLAEALGAYREADEVISSGSEPFSVIENDGFFGSRDAAVRRLISGLARSGQAHGAFTVAVRGFQRSLGSLTLPARVAALDPERSLAWQEHMSSYRALRSRIERLGLDDWRLSLDQLGFRVAERRALDDEASRHLRLAWQLLGRFTKDEPAELALAPGELLLLTVPGRERWWGFVASQEGTDVGPLEQTPDQSPEAAVTRWLNALGERLSTASHVSVLPYGLSRNIDFAALAVGGAPLIERLPLVYRLGLDAASVRARARSSVLIVGDPSDELTAAREEARQVALTLAADRRELLIGPLATRESILERLPHVSLFHYAGHGESLDAEGAPGLLLADGARLSPSDVLGSSGVPAQVVLAACNMGRGAMDAWTGGWSMAHAFVLAGSREVVAAVDRVPDSSAAQLLSWLYRERSEHPTRPLRELLAAAQRRAHHAGVPSWRSFRVLAP